MSLSCLKKLKVGDVIHTRGTFFNKEYKVVEVQAKLVKVINVCNGFRLDVVPDNFNHKIIFKIVKAK